MTWLTESAEIFLRVRSSGDPIIRIIWSNWSWLSLPLKRGTPEIISAKMQPHDQTSIEVLYVREPRRTSGARYHNVTTCERLSPRYAVQTTLHTSFENVLTGTPKALARPKSPIFNSPFLLINKFCGFKSRCRTRFS